MQHHRLVSAARFLGTGLDVLLLGLLAVAVLRTAPGAPFAVALALGVAFAAVHLGGRRLLRRRGAARPGTRAGSGVWPSAAVLTQVCLLTALWVGLLVVSDAAVWLAFPLMVVQMLALGPHVGVLGVGATFLLSVLASVLVAGPGAFTVGMVLGPGLGGAVAVGLVLGFQALVRESAEHERVATELLAAREHLAQAERGRAVAGERERLAREIHDTLAQGLSAIELLLRAAEPAIGTDDERAQHLVFQARAAARENLDEARRVVRALAPADLDGSTLVDALRRVAARTEQTAPDLAVHVQVVGPPHPLPVPVETALLRVAQSALANVTQHADARHVRLTLTFDADGALLDVVDDGVGMAEPAGTEEGTGFGLVAMRSRLRELGGTLTVESAPGEGTALAARVPLPAGSPA